MRLGNRYDKNNSNNDGIDLLADRVAEVVRLEILMFFERGER